MNSIPNVYILFYYAQAFLAFDTLMLCVEVYQLQLLVKKQMQCL